MHKKSPRLNAPFPNARFKKQKIKVQNNRAATNLTQNPSAYIVISVQFTTNSIFPVLSVSGVLCKGQHFPFLLISCKEKKIEHNQ